MQINGQVYVLFIHFVIDLLTLFFEAFDKKYIHLYLYIYIYFYIYQQNDKWKYFIKPLSHLNDLNIVPDKTHNRNNVSSKIFANLAPQLDKITVTMKLTSASVR